MDLQRSALQTRTLGPEDRAWLLDAIYTDPHTYYYPGWTSLHDWLEDGWGWALLSEHTPVAALVIVPESDTRGWLRLFLSRADVPRSLAWRLLWHIAAGPLREQGLEQVVSLGGRGWVDRFFHHAGFRPAGQLRLLLWRAVSAPEPTRGSGLPGVRLAPMLPGDVAAATQVDRLAFDPAWRLRPGLVQRAWEQARLALIARTADQLIGYALFSPSPQGAHLARLAVHPHWQGRGVGRALVRAGLQRLAREDPTVWVSVNTQADNRPALRLYASLGFVPQEPPIVVWAAPLPTPARRESRLQPVP